MRRKGDNNEKTFFAENAELPVLASSLDNIYKKVDKEGLGEQTALDLEKDIKAVKTSVKGKSFDKWVEILRTTFNNDSILRIRVEKGIFKQGDNKIVDKEIYKESNAKIREMKDYPYTATFGKLLKAPEELGDVRALVTSDYQEIKEQEWLEELKKRYPATINEDVLNTIQ